VRAAEGCQTGRRNPDRNLRFFLPVPRGLAATAAGASVQGFSARLGHGAACHGRIQPPDWLGRGQEAKSRQLGA
jgi:hypothetical protein